MSGEWLKDRWLQPFLDASDLRIAVRRGRVINRKGWVRDVKVANGIFTAEVNSDAGVVHHVKVRMDVVDGDVWGDVVAIASDEAALSGDLLNGAVTNRVASLFEECGQDLFPFDLRDLTIFCSCSHSGAGCCQHAVAASFKFAELISVDGTLLLQLRGRAHDELTADLRAQRTGASIEEEPPEEDLGVRGPEELLEGFWVNGVMPNLVFKVIRAKEGELLPIVRALGAAPNGSTSNEVANTLTPLVRLGLQRLDAIAERADVVALEAPSPPPKDPNAAPSLDDMLIDAARARGELTSAFVADALGVNQRDARKYLQWLVEEGRLRITGRARGTRYLPVD